MKKVFSLMLLLATIVTFTSCGDDDEPDNTKLSKTTYTLYHEETKKIEGTNVSDLVWDSENEFVATVKNGVITGQFVGKTKVKSTKSLSFTAEVKPKYHLYEEPCLDWGASKSSIKAKYGTPDNETSDGLIYMTGNTNVPIMMFMFENGGLKYSGVVCKISSAYTLVDFLAERYLTVNLDVNKYTAYYAHCFGKLSDPRIDYGVGMKYSSSIGGLLVTYMPVESSKSKSVENISFDSAVEAFESVMK